ncbi:MAG: DUF2306 domain-containing protein [Hyphomonas sp.]
MDHRGNKLTQWAGWVFWAGFLSLLGLVLAATLALSPLKASYDGRHFIHIASGSVFLGLAPFQFIGAVRRRFPAYHRLAGRVLVAAALLAILSTFAIHRTPIGTEGIPSQTVLLLIWLGSILAAVWCIRHGDVVWHQRHMARAVVAGAYFLLIRMFDRFIGADAVLGFEENPSVQFANSDWLGWLVPMIAVELFMTLTTGGRGKPSASPPQQ